MLKAYLKTGFLFLLAIATSGVMAQNAPIKGTVLDQATSSPLQGATIHLKGSTTTAVSDENGKFQIHAIADQVLEVSYTGYDTEEWKVLRETMPTIYLKASSSKLEEVVVVGYGTQNRRNVTSAISKLDNKVLQNAPRSNVANALQGTIPGVQVVNSTGQPGATPMIMLRGGASINSPGSPLVVVDGVIRDYNDIPAQNIESIELLKDAAATAIYGARANNGVVLITTKQGKNGKAEITYKYTAGYNKRRDLYHYMNAKDYIYYNRTGNLNSGRKLTEVNQGRGYGLFTDSANLSSFDIRPYNSATAYLLNMGWDTVGDPYGGTIIFKDHSGEIEDIVFRNTQTHDHYINVVGGNDRGKYFASFDYYKEKGIIIGSDYKRYALDLNGSYKIKPNLEITTGTTISTSSQYGTIGGDVNTLYRSMAIWPTFNPWIDSAKTMPNPGNSISDGNPLYWLDKNIRNNEVTRVTANAAVKWDITRGLYLQATGAGYLYQSLSEGFTKATQLYTNIFQPVPTYSSTTRPSYAAYSRFFQQQYNAILNYTKQIGNHSINPMLGVEYYGIRNFDMQVSGTKSPTDDIYTVNAATAFAAGANYSTRSEYRILSAFGRLNYDFNNRYLLQLVFRQDGVSSLAEGHQFGFFPGMSAGWNLHHEPFFKNSGLSDIVSIIKPRFSYGVNGNVAGLGRYEVQGSYSSQGLYNGASGFSYTGLVNSNLRWEKSTTADAGLDLGLFRNKINILFDYYIRNTSDLLTQLQLPTYTGFSSFRTNLGVFQNKGYELSVTANLVNKDNSLKIDVGSNASYVQNKIKKLPYNGNQNNRQGGLQVYDPNTQRVIWVGGLQEGGTLGDIYAYKQVSIFKNDEEIRQIANNRIDIIANISGPGSTYGSGKITPGDVNWLDVDRNDTIDSRDQVRVGNIYPKWTGGFWASAGYKGISLYGRFEYALGHTIYNDLVARTLGNYQGTFNYFDLQKQAWSPTNTDTDIPKVYYADQVAAPLGKKNYTRSNNAAVALNSNNSRFYESGDYLALREVTLAYNLGQSIVSRTKFFTAARIYVTGSNLAYFTKFSGPTPEPPVTPGTNTITGIYTGTYPTPKSYVLGIQLTL
ncbi:SusC/RagA family TonB-linked outer membrane protein [Niabella sp. CC-SYL272]|uniref:SusC/RagA family TonB-linked outer membrane protein n=1 Tax=Niabella agricola TaxID=2891571 RepID=UPI001F15C1E9|nr:SusC/RagA family TonB-linked outer membrane protein [Niabella agricola]MCF3107694.1 SusC/RagA family TonB-linked outer membrane protein [Niabella agricola]